MTSSKLAVLFASLVLGASTAVIGCNDDNKNNDDTVDSGTGTGTDAAGGQVSTISSDGQIFAILSAVNSAEIEQGQVAQDRAVAEGVKLYATGMVEMHKKAESDQTDLRTRLGLSNETSALGSDLVSQQSALTTELKNVAAADFDVKYVDAQIANHSKVLDLLDQQLAPAAKNADVVDAVKDFRSAVEDHLQWAKKVRGDLKGPDGGTL
jgi:predicted outer membrane protein